MSGFELVGSDGKSAAEIDVLWEAWVQGKAKPEGAYSKFDKEFDDMIHSNSCWDLPIDQRLAKLQSWSDDMLEEAEEEAATALMYSENAVSEFRSLLQTKSIEVLRNSNVILCTTTGAAKNEELLHATDCDVVLVEEAGEILEPHILASIYRAKSLIMIGDHLQLRPKVRINSLIAHLTRILIVDRPTVGGELHAESRERQRLQFERLAL